MSRKPMHFFLFIALGFSFFLSICVAQNERWSCRFAAETYSNGGGAWPGIHIDSGDLDGDQDIDLIVRHLSDTTIYSSLLLNDGLGRFESEVLGTGLGNGLIEDVNDDGHFDLVFYSVPNAVIRVMLNLGEGQFGTPVSYGDVRVQNIEFGDFNQDGSLDVVGVLPELDEAIVLFNLGNGIFGNQQTIDVDIGSRDLRIGDLNTDGALDIIIQNDVELNVYIGDKNGKFEKGPSISGQAVSDFQLADMNGDQISDLCLAKRNQNVISILTNNGDANFEILNNRVVPRYPTSLLIGDIDSDGDNDVVVNHPAEQTSILFGEATIFKNDGTGKLVDPVRYPVADSTSQLATMADFDCDNDLDLVIGNTGEGEWVTLFNSGFGRFESTEKFKFPGEAPTSNQPLVAADFDGDGDPDFALGNGGSQKIIAMENLDGLGFRMFDAPTVGGFVREIVSTDANSDGGPDLAILDSNNTLSILLNDGTGQFLQPAMEFDLGPMPNRITFGDVDGDNNFDLVYLDDAAQAIVSYLNDGTGNLIFYEQFFVGDDITDLNIGDFDNDGISDLVAVRSTNGEVILLQNNGKGIFDQTSFITNSSFSRVAVGDIDNDNDLDLILTSSGFNESRIGRNDATGEFTFEPINVRTFDPISIHDFDRDDDLDVMVFSSVFSSDIALYENDGFGKFEFRSRSFDGFTNDRVVADLDGDLDLDVVSVDRLTNTLRISRNSCRLLGDMNHDETVNLLDVDPFVVALLTTECRAEADVNQDGRLDLLDVSEFVSLLTCK